MFKRIFEKPRYTVAAIGGLVAIQGFILTVVDAGLFSVSMMLLGLAVAVGGLHVEARVFQSLHAYVESFKEEFEEQFMQNEKQKLTNPTEERDLQERRARASANKLETTRMFPQSLPATEVKVEVHPQPAKASSLGIGSIILGILALSVAWVPWFGLYASPLGVLGLILGVIGFVVAMWRSGSGIGFAIAGSAISALALFIGISVNRDIVIAGFEQAQAAIRRSQQRGNEDLQQNELGAANDEIAVANADPWDNATTVAEDDTVRVEIVSTEIRKVKTYSLFGDERMTKENWLTIAVKIQNRTDAKKFTYNSWGNPRGVSVRSKLTDDLGNEYDSYFLDTISDQLISESIYPGKSVTDLLVFETPVGKANYLKLTLPKGKYGGGEGELLLKIPMPRESISEKKLPAIPDNGHKQEAKKNQVVIDVDGAEPLDEVLTILVADRSYAVWRMTPEVTGYFLAEFDELVRLARNAKPNDDGVRVRILRSESAKVSAWQKLQTELVQAGIPAEAIVLTKDLVVMSVRKGTSMRGE